MLQHIPVMGFLFFSLLSKYYWNTEVPEDFDPICLHSNKTRYSFLCAVLRKVEELKFYSSAMDLTKLWI